MTLKAGVGKLHFLMQDLAVNFTVLPELWPHSQDVTAAGSDSFQLCLLVITKTFQS